MRDKQPEIPVLHIYHSQDAELYRAKIREDKVYLKDEKVAQFSNRGVFTIKDLRGHKKKKFKALIYLDGKVDCAKIKTTTDEEKKKALEEAEKNPKQLQVIPETQETIFEALTDKDRKTVVKREIAKQLGKFKPLETWQFLIIIGLLGALLGLQLLRMF